MRLPDHYVRNKYQAFTPRPVLGPLRSLVLHLTPADRLLTAGDIARLVSQYLENHPGERREVLEGLPHERVTVTCLQHLDELVEDGFVRRILSRDLNRLLSKF